MRFPRLLNLAAIVLSLVCQQAVQAQQFEILNDKIKNGEVTIRRALVMPARAEVNREGLKGQEGMTKEADALAVKFTNEAEETLKNAGLEVVPSPFSAEKMAGNGERQAELLRLQNQFDDVSRQLNPNKDYKRTSQRIREGGAKVGEDSISGGSFENVDAIVFPRVKGSALTGGRRAMLGGVGGMLVKTAMKYELLFVSAQTGEILAYYSALHNSSLKKQMNTPVLGRVEKQIRATMGPGKKKTKKH